MKTNPEIPQQKLQKNVKSYMKSTLHALFIGEFTWKRLARSVVLIPTGVAIGLLAIAVFFPDRVIFRPPMASYADSERIIKIPTDSGATVSAEYYQNPQAEYTILFSHGNAEDIGMLDLFARRLRGAGFSVLTYDYQGYGTSSGGASEKNAYSDIDAAFEYLVTEKGVPDDKVILHGRSLGGAVAVDLASRRKVGGLILESTFTTAFRVVTRYSILPFDKFASLDKIIKVGCPVLFVHGTEDRTVPLYHAERLFDAAREPKYTFWIDGAGHNDIPYVGQDRYFKALTDFAETLSSR